jgi:hypothetical protein
MGLGSPALSWKEVLGHLGQHNAGGAMGAAEEREEVGDHASSQGLCPRSTELRHTSDALQRPLPAAPDAVPSQIQGSTTGLATSSP